MVRPTSPPATASKIRQGRPPKIALDDIIATALEIGLDQATLKNVAERLGVTVPGLWYHVRTRDDLIALVMESATRRYVDSAGDPADFREALSTFSYGLYAWLSDHPVVITQIAAHRSVQANADIHMQWLLKHAGQNGISRDSAMRSMALVTAAAIGAATLEANRRAARTDPNGDSAENDHDFFQVVRIVIDAIFGTPIK